MLAIAKAVGFPPAFWFEDASADGTPADSAEGLDLAASVGHLLETILHPRTGGP
jgi:hypothetical protein